MKYFFIVLSVLILTACGPSKKERAQQQINDGIKMLHRSQFTEALAHFNKALELNPELSEAYVYKAKVWINKGDYKQAIEDAGAAIEIQPQNGEAYNTRAQAYFYTGDRMSSCSDWRKADELGIPNLENKIRHCP